MTSIFVEWSFHCSEDAHCYRRNVAWRHQELFCRLQIPPAYWLPATRSQLSSQLSQSEARYKAEIEILTLSYDKNASKILSTHIPYSASDMICVLHKYLLEENPHASSLLCEDYARSVHQQCGKRVTERMAQKVDNLQLLAGTNSRCSYKLSLLVSIFFSFIYMCLRLTLSRMLDFSVFGEQISVLSTWYVG